MPIAILTPCMPNIKQDDKGKFYSKCRGYIPIIHLLVIQLNFKHYEIYIICYIGVVRIFFMSENLTSMELKRRETRSYSFPSTNDTIFIRVSKKVYQPILIKTVL